MSEFVNKLIIKEEQYKGGLFPTIPKYNKKDSVFILSGGIYDDIVVDGHTTEKEIRQGKYTKLIEFSLLPYIKEIRFESPSKESAYSFEIYVKVVIQVKNPKLFFQNKNIDVDAYFEKLFLMNVRKITKKYSILSDDGIDEELAQELSAYNIIDDATGLAYRIAIVGATPGENAKEYVYRYSNQQLDATLKSNARKLSEYYTDSYEAAVMTEVAEGKRSEAEAILEIGNYKESHFDSQVEKIEALRDKGFLTDKAARELVTPVLEEVEIKKSTENFDSQGRLETTELDKFYIGD